MLYVFEYSATGTPFKGYETFKRLSINRRNGLVEASIEMLLLDSTS